MTLTPKQETFTQAYVETGNASEAYRRAYNTDRMSDAAVNVQASRLLNHPKVALRIRELQAEVAQRNAVTVDRVVQGLLAIAEDPEAPHSARVSAWSQLGKHTGGFVDRLELTIDDRHEIERLAAQLGLPVEDVLAEDVLAEADAILKANRR